MTSLALSKHDLTSKSNCRHHLADHLESRAPSSHPGVPSSAGGQVKSSCGLRLPGSRRLPPRLSRIDQARTYFLCGGVPLYLRRSSDSRSIKANLAAELLDEYAPLYREADFLLR